MRSPNCRSISRNVFARGSVWTVTSIALSALLLERREGDEMADTSSPTRKYVRLEEMPDEEPHARAPAAPKFLREHTAKDLEREALDLAQ
mgnify:CR=1 FL=1